jgi:hypothetical protein
LTIKAIYNMKNIARGQDVLHFGTIYLHFDGVFVVPTQSIRRNLGEVNETASQQLPKYMVPTGYLVVSQLPPTLPAKLNCCLLRQRAAALSAEKIGLYTNCELHKRRPVTVLESLVHQVCASVLQWSLDSIGH